MITFTRTRTGTRGGNEIVYAYEDGHEHDVESGEFSTHREIAPPTLRRSLRPTLCRLHFVVHSSSSHSF